MEAGGVDIYLYSAESGRGIQNWTSVNDQAGAVDFSPGDGWWEGNERADEVRTGERNQTWPFYFVVVPEGQALNGGEVHQSTFNAIREYIHYLSPLPLGMQ